VGIILGNASTGVTVKGVPLQVAKGMFAIEGRGFTVTVNVKLLTHWLGTAPEVAVTVYVAVAGAVPGFIRVPAMEATLPAAPPVMPPVTVGGDQL
jgi:hypothetical protein